MKVRIKKISKKAYGGQQPDGALDVTPAAWGGADMRSAKEGAEVQQSLTSVPRSKANLEAEGGETAFGPISGDTIPDHYKIKGPRHTNGGVPLNLPDDTFIFSDTKAMKITDPKILTMFGKKAKKGGYTPADLAKPFDINKYKGILMDSDTDRKERETAELMVKNYIMKLGALALAQESKKGFPQGIPEMARPYMEANGITDEQLLPQQEQEGGAGEQPMMRIGGNLNTYEGDEDGSTVNENKKTLSDVESYKNSTGEQKALFESLTPEQRKMMVSTAGQQQKGQPARDASGRIIQRDDYGGNYDQQRRYPNQRGGKPGFSDFNPFGQRAFTRDFDYLTPFKGPSFSGTNMPFTGQMPAGNNQLTSFSQKYKKNPLLKSMFSGWINPEKNVARRELTNTWNFNGANSSTPSLAGGNNAISNFKVPQLDFNQSTQSGVGAQGQQEGQTQQGSLSNRQFARDFQNQGFGSKGKMRRNLRRGDMTQQEYLDLMDQEGSSTATTATTGSGPIPKPDNSAIPSWITDPIGSATSGTPNNESMITDQIRNSVMNSGNVIDEPSRLPVRPTGMLSRPATKMPQSLQNQDLIKAGKNASAIPLANEAAHSLGSNLNQMRTDAGMYDTTPTNTPFDFSTDRTQPTYTFGQPAITKSLDTQGTDMYRRSLVKDGVDDGRNNNPNTGNLFGFDEGGIIGYDENGNPIYAPGTEPEIVDTWFDKGYYGDRGIGQRKTGEEGFETSAGGVDFSSVDYVPKAESNKGNTLTYQKAMEKFPADVFDFETDTEMPSEEDVESYNNSGERILWGPEQDRQNEQAFTLEYKQKNFYPKKDRILNWYNTLSPHLKGKEALDFQVQRDAMLEKLEEEFDKKYGFQDYDLDYSSRPSGELTGSYTGLGANAGPGYGGEGQGFKRAFGGENPILDMFVYGGDNKYPHGGSFHMPMNDYAKDFQSNTNQFTKLDNPYAQTADDPIVNPITGESPAVVYNSQTGSYDETNPEYAEGNNPFSVENTQKINSAFTFKPSVAMAQAGALGNVIGTGYDAVNAGLNTVDANNNLTDITDGSKQSTFKGGDMANNMGQVKYRDDEGYSQYTLTKYGGTPMAEYGAEMGGSYYPTMGDGGTRKVRILPKANLGIVAYAADGTPMTQEQLNAYRKKNPNAKVTPTKKSKKELTDEGYIDMGDGTFGRGDISGEGSADREFNVPTNITNTNVDVCAEIKKGRGGKSFTRGEALAVGMVNESTADKYAGCYRVEDSGAEKADFVKVEAEETIDKKTGKKKCKCFKLDEQGNQTEEVISETIVNADEECPVCEATVEAMRGADPKDPGGYSDFERKGFTNALKIKTGQYLPNVAYQSRGDASSMKVTPRTADITAQGNQSVRAMQAAGMRPAQIVAALSGPMAQKNLAESGRRYNLADQYNAKVVTDDSWKTFAANQAVDKTNTALFNNAAGMSAQGKNKQTQLENAKGVAKYAALGAGEKGRLARAQINFDLEDWQLDRNGNPYKRYNPKDPNPTKPKETLSQVYDRWKSKGMDDPNIGRLAVEEWKSNNARYGGFIPRYTTMPYGK